MFGSKWILPDEAAKWRGDLPEKVDKTSEGDGTKAGSPFGRRSCPAEKRAGKKFFPAKEIFALRSVP
jgi:hypothetical protein